MLGGGDSALYARSDPRLAFVQRGKGAGSINELAAALADSACMVLPSAVWSEGVTAWPPRHLPLKEYVARVQSSARAPWSLLHAQVGRRPHW
jgi:hypothetical protein